LFRHISAPYLPVLRKVVAGTIYAIEAALLLKAKRLFTKRDRRFLISIASIG